MNPIIAILLFLIVLVVVSCGIIISICFVKRRRALAAAAQVLAGAAAPHANGAAVQGQVLPRLHRDRVVAAVSYLLIVDHHLHCSIINLMAFQYVATHNDLG